jgi:histidinol phosphatase-like enzyme (inositol monophosphatase family)
VSKTLDEHLALAHRLADAAGEVIRPYFRQRIDVTDKGAAGGKAYDPVTEADRKAEAAMRAIIKRERPQDAILGEEHGHEPGSSGLIWVIDPIDGTRAFITGQMQWGTLIALNEKSSPVLGILDQPVLGERFVGTPKRTTMHSREGEKVLKTRARAGLAEAVLMTTNPWGYFTDEEHAAFRRLSQVSQMTRFGGDCYAYGLIAMGFVDLVVEARLEPWDIQALIPIVQGAGGIVTDWEGKPVHEGGRVIAAGDKHVHAQAMAVLRKSAH